MISDVVAVETTMMMIQATIQKQVSSPHYIHEKKEELKCCDERILDLLKACCCYEKIFFLTIRLANTECQEWRKNVCGIFQQENYEADFLKKKNRSNHNKKKGKK